MASLLPIMTNKSQPLSASSTAAAEFAYRWGDGDLGDVWEDAGLPKVAKYIFSAKGLRVPKGWEWLIPTSI